MRKNNSDLLVFTFKVECYMPLSKLVVRLYKTTDNIYYLINDKNKKKILDREIKNKIINLLDLIQIVIPPEKVIFTLDGCSYSLEINRGENNITIEWGNEVPEEWGNLETFADIMLRYFKLHNIYER